MVRAMLEDLAGQLAAPHFKGATAPLKKTAAAIRDAARKKDIAAYARHDIQFHRSIVEGASNRILLRTWNSLAFEVRLQLWLSRSNLDLTTAQESHWKVIEALEQGHGKRAGQLLRGHILHSASEELIQIPK